MDNLFGLDLVLHIVEKDINKKSDVLVIFAHWLFSKSGFKCIGVGESETFTGEESSCDVPPEGWNAQETYAIRYVKDEKLFILRGIKSDDDLVFNLLRVSDLEVTSVAINISDTVCALTGKIEELMPKYSDVMKCLQEELLNPMNIKPCKSATTQTSQEWKPDQGANPPRYRPRRRGSSPDSEFDVDPDPFRHPFRGLRVGQNDLDPFSSSTGGGMLLDPFNRGPGVGARPGNLPRGAVPPGARFDPFGPPDIPDLNFPHMDPSRGLRDLGLPGSRRGPQGSFDPLRRSRDPGFGPRPNPDFPSGFDNMFM